MKRLGLGGMIFVLAMGFLFLAFEALIAPAEAAVTGGVKPAVAGTPEKKAAKTASRGPAVEAKPTGTSADDGCITDAAKVIVSLIESKNDRTILEEQLKISVMKLALDTMGNGTKVAEDLVKKAEADIEAKDINKVLPKLEAVYAEFGQQDDLKKVHSKFNQRQYVKRKPNDPWKARFGTRDISAYVQAKTLLQDEASSSKKYSKVVRYGQVDAAIFWYQSMITDRLDELAGQGIKSAKIGNAVRNQEELTWKTANLTGYMKGIPALSASQLKAEIANSKSKIAAFFERASDLLKEKLKEKCPESFVNNTLCLVCDGSDNDRETVNVEVIKQIMAKMRENTSAIDPLLPKKVREEAKLEDLKLELEPAAGEGFNPNVEIKPIEGKATGGADMNSTPQADTKLGANVDIPKELKPIEIKPATTTTPAVGTAPTTVDPNTTTSKPNGRGKPSQPAEGPGPETVSPYVRNDGDGKFTFTGIGLDQLKKEGQIVANGLVIPKSKGCQFFFASGVMGAGPGAPVEQRLLATMVQTRMRGDGKLVVNEIKQNDQKNNLRFGNSHISLARDGRPVLKVEDGEELSEVVLSLFQNNADEVAQMCGLSE